MAVQRQMNFLGGMRVDVPHMRMLESAVAADFQVLSGTLMAGRRALVAWGAVILDQGVVGAPASSLILRMAGATFLHATAAEAGAIYSASPTQPDDVLSGTNSRVVGSFAPGVHQVNYVSVDLVRLADPDTEDAVVFESPDTGEEFTQTVPLGRVLQYRIYVSTSDFSATPTRCPIAKVVVDAAGNVEQVVDCRQMLWRLGTGGTVPNPLAQYSWLNRNESSSPTAFAGGDKDIASQADFNRAVTQRLWELGGGERWYSPADDRTVQLTYDNTSVFPATGENWQWTGSDLLWRGLSFWLACSTATENVVTDVTSPTPGLTNLADGELIYVELNRYTNATVTPVKASWGTLFALPPSTPGSRHVLAWKQHGRVYAGHQSLVVNSGGVHATNTSFGTVRLWSAFVPDSPNPVVPVMDAAAAVVLADPTASANVIARGITRDAPGLLSLGTGTNDTSVTLGRGGTTVTVNSRLVVQATTSSDTSTVASSKGYSDSIAPVGVVLPFAGAAAPANYLLCDGSAVSRALWSVLFAVIGTTYGAGNGTTTFNVPDLRGRAPIGVGQGAGLIPRTLNQIGGEEFHQLSTNELPAHNHGVTDPGHVHNIHVYDNTDTPMNTAAGSNAPGTNTFVPVTESATTGITTQNAGSNIAHNNMQPYIALNFIIRAI